MICMDRSAIKAIFIILVGGALAVVLFLRFWPDRSEEIVDVVPQQHEIDMSQYDGVVVVGGNTVPVSIADTALLREKGLSDTVSLPRKTGKLFVFDLPGMYGFWMKDMQYPIDIIWIDESYNVVSVTENVGPETYPSVFYPDRSVQYVLEVNAYEAKTLGFYPGVIVNLNKEF